MAVEYVSVDAGTRTMLRGKGFHRQVGIGDTILAGGVGRIVESTVDGWDIGQAVRGGLGVQAFVTVGPEHLEKIDESMGSLSSYLGVFGASTGVTAWIGMRCVAKPKPGDVFVVTAAGDAVGSIAGQIAKRDGAYVIGIAGVRRRSPRPRASGDCFVDDVRVAVPERAQVRHENRFTTRHRVRKRKIIGESDVREPHHHLRRQRRRVHDVEVPSVGVHHGDVGEHRTE